MGKEYIKKCKRVRFSFRFLFVVYVYNVSPLIEKEYSFFMWMVELGKLVVRRKKGS